MMLPLAIKPVARLIGIDVVEVKPLGPPRLTDWSGFVYTYDERAYQISRRNEKIKKLQEKIKERQCYRYHQQL